MLVLVTWQQQQVRQASGPPGTRGLSALGSAALPPDSPLAIPSVVRDVFLQAVAHSRQEAQSPCELPCLAPLRCPGHPSLLTELPCTPPLSRAPEPSHGAASTPSHVPCASASFCLALWIPLPSSSAHRETILIIQNPTPQIRLLFPVLLSQAFIHPCPTCCVRC